MDLSLQNNNKVITENTIDNIFRMMTERFANDINSSEELISYLGGNGYEKNLLEEVDKLNDNDNPLKDIIKNITFSVGPEPEHTYGFKRNINKKTFTREELEILIDDIVSNTERKWVIVTYGGTIKKLRSPFNERVCIWGLANKNKKGEWNKDAIRIMVIYDIIRKNPQNFDIVSKNASGIGYEELQITHINKVFKELKLIKPLPLYINGQPTNVLVNGSEKVPGHKKADFALTNNGEPVFWISYKHGNYMDRDNNVIPKVPFQQYGELRTLYSKKLNDDMRNSVNQIFDKFFIEVSKELSSIGKQFIYKNKTLDQLNDLYNNFPDNIYSDKDGTAEVRSKFKSVIKKVKGNKYTVLFIPDGFNGYSILDYDAEKYNNVKLFVLKSIYGIDFGETKDYGEENVNIILQTAKEVNIKPVMNDKQDVIGIDISPDNQGHIMYNGEIPKENDEMLLYTPVLNIRHTKASYFVYKNIIIMSCRLFIFPYGNLPKAAIKIGVEIDL
jgi:hypothetical protein